MPSGTRWEEYTRAATRVLNAALCRSSAISPPWITIASARGCGGTARTPDVVPKRTLRQVSSGGSWVAACDCAGRPAAITAAVTTTAHLTATRARVLTGAGSANSACPAVLQSAEAVDEPTRRGRRDCRRPGGHRVSLRRAQDHELVVVRQPRIAACAERIVVVVDHQQAVIGERQDALDRLERHRVGGAQADVARPCRQRDGRRGGPEHAE